MQVKEVMSHDVVEIPADATLAEALKLLSDQRSSIVGVYDEGQLAGTLTEHDIAVWQSAAGHDPTTARVREVMHPRGGYVTEDQDVSEVTNMMRKEHLPGMVVVKDHHAVGTLSLADVAAQAMSGASDGQVVSSALPARVFLQPIAAPSILGFFALAGAWWIVGSQMAGWYGNAKTPQYIFPFVGLFGGLAQLLASMWAFKARDGLATIIHGMWGVFFLAYGLLYWGTATGMLSTTAINPGFGYWFIPLAAISGSCALAAMFETSVISLEMWVLTVASILMAVAMLGSFTTLTKIAAYFFMASAVIAWYVGTGLLFEGTTRRAVLPLGRIKMIATRMGGVISRPVEYKFGEPGVRAGQ